MKLNKLKQLIKEEIQNVLNEERFKKILKEKSTETAPTVKPGTKEKETTPKRRTLAPPKESPNTKPKALMKENEKELVNKIAQRFKKLSK